MGRQVSVVLYVVAMVAVIVGVDFGFFRKPILKTVDGEHWHCLGTEMQSQSARTPAHAESLLFAFGTPLQNIGEIARRLG